MQEVYSDSMTYKRRLFETWSERAIRTQQLNLRYETPEITQEFLNELQQLVLSSNLRDIADYYGVSYTWIQQVCKQHDILTRSKGWHFKKHYLGIPPIYWEKF